MKTIGALAGLSLVGIIIADLVTHPEGVIASGNALKSVLVPTYAAMLGYRPS